MSFARGARSTWVLLGCIGLSIRQLIKNVVNLHFTLEIHFRVFWHLHECANRCMLGESVYLKRAWKRHSISWRASVSLRKEWPFFFKRATHQMIPDPSNSRLGQLLPLPLCLPQCPVLKLRRRANLGGKRKRLPWLNVRLSIVRSSRREYCVLRRKFSS